MQLPARITDELQLADWAELNALLADDGDYSFGELERELNRSGAFGDEEVEAKLAEVAFEINSRSQAAGAGYPFEFDGALLTVREPRDNFLPYLFCLCLSYFGWRNQAGAAVFPARMFEWLAVVAARKFVQGQAIRFGAPREEPVPAGFRDAVNYLCVQIGEGLGIQPGNEPVGQDATLDIVAWRDFPDARAGKLLLFGQCAAGANWTDKVSELQPRDFCDAWMQQAPSSNLLKALFIPHRVETNRWRLHTIPAKLIFDRCRIAFLAQTIDDIPDRQGYIDWYRGTLQEQ